MIRTKKISSYTLLAVTLTTLTACGGSNNTPNNSTNPTDHPIFKWTDAGVSNNYLPLGDTTNQTPTFTWPAYTDSGSRATEYNFGYQSTNGDGWREYTVAAAGANCSSGDTCTYKPSNHVFNIGDQKAWWVRGSINGTWKEWSSAHVFKIVRTTTPPGGGGDYQPSGDTPTTQPTFKWPRVGSNSSYELGLESQTGSGWKSFNPSCSTSTCTYTPNAGLSIGNNLTWWVRPAGGAWSDGVDFSITQGGGGTDTQAPTTPANLRKTGATSTSASLRWNASSDNVTVAGYRIYRNGQQIATATSTSATDSGLNPATAYNYTVRAFDAAGNVSSNSATLRITTESGSTTTQEISWPPINGATRYELGMEKQNGTNWQSFVKTPAQLNCQSGTCSTAPHNSFQSGDQVIWWVRAFVNGSWQAWSGSHRITLSNGGGADTQAPTTPASLRQVSATASRIVVRWNASTDNTAVTGYRVYRNGTQIGSVSGTTYTDNSVTAASTYTYTVRAFDAANNVSPSSNTLSVTTPQANDTQAPTVPASLRQVSVAQTNAVIRWNASTDNRAVTGYRVFRNGSQVGTATGTTYTDNGVTAGNTYSYRVSAVDAAGNQSAQSTTLSVTTPPSVPLAKVIINEVLAGNTVTNMDTDYYKFSDWIELHNTTNQSQNISGFYLSDDAATPTKWKIPAGTTLAANQYLMVWADKKDTKANELHANFSLSSKGETLTLANTAGTVVDTLTFGKIDTGVSAGKSGNTVVYFVPTPKAQNSTAYSSGKGAKKPSFSNDAGFFSSRLNLTISQENNGSVYYTRDGSTPTTSSTRYTGAITLDDTTVIKALAIESGKLPSKVVTNTYFINHQSNLPVVSLSMENDHLFDDTVGIYTVGTNGTPHVTCNNVIANYAQDWDRPIHVEYFDQNQTRALSFGADTGLTGECSRRKAKKSFGFELDGKYGDKSLSYKLFPGKDLGKIKDFKVRTANSGYRVGDIVGAQLIEQGGLDIDYQAYRAVQMFMNGEYWGIYNIREKKGAESLEANYPNLGKVDIIKAYIVKKGDYTDYGQFNSFLNAHDLATNANYQQALSYFDEASFMDYMAFMIYNGNLDWIGGNMRTWKEKKAGAKWRWMA
ncbi:MAG: lamin tail domain-containing protein, partial [Cocleimonas sp.]